MSQDREFVIGRVEFNPNGGFRHLPDDLSPTERRDLAGQFAQALAEMPSMSEKFPYGSRAVERLVNNGMALEEETLP